MGQLFGTDGVRGLANKDLTAEIALDLSVAAAHVLGEQARVVECHVADLLGTQASTRPPTFVLFTTGFLDPGYRRFIQRRLRELYSFEGTPIVINMRVREKRQR